MELAKLGGASLLAIGSLAFFRYAYGKPWEAVAYRRLIVCGTVLKFALAFAIYRYYPALVGSSDAKSYYFPQVLRLLSGQVPYRDFRSSYSILFTPLLAGPVALWRSVGAIVMTMLTFETVMLALYLRRCRATSPVLGWRTTFLYGFSPISWYWVALGGYNGPIIAMFVLLSLILAEQGKNVLAGIAGACSFLFCKLLAVLAWPGIVLSAPRGRVARTWPLLASLALSASLLLFGVDSLSPVVHEFPRRTSGNLWFVVSQFVPQGDESRLWNLLPVVTFVCCLLLLIRSHLSHPSDDRQGQFDRSVALVASTNLLFMVLSRKSYTFYMPMCLLFILHTVVLDGGYLWGRLSAVAVLGATTTIEPHLFQLVRGAEWPLRVFPSITALLLLLDAVLVACYVYLIFVCLRVRHPGSASADADRQAPFHAVASHMSERTAR